MEEKKNSTLVMCPVRRTRDEAGGGAGREGEGAMWES